MTRFEFRYVAPRLSFDESLAFFSLYSIGHSAGPPRPLQLSAR